MKITGFCLAAILTAGVVYADFEGGLAAYDRGDFARAVAEWQPIAERGDANAQYNMGLLYACGEGVPRDYQKAAEWYRQSAEQGVVAAEYNLAVLYANGQGVARSSQDAAEWFRKAAESGVTAAAASLADIYYQGDGVGQNYAEAEKWYRKAADQGIPSAQFGLGVMNDLGQGVPQNYEEAIAWYTKAAEAGYAPAMTNLGILYYNAQGEKRDLVQAYAWLARGQKAGDPRAAELVKTTADRMKPKDVTHAQAVAEEWQPSRKASNDPMGQAAIARLFKQPQVTPASGAPPQAGTASVAAPSTPQDVWTGVDRVIAVGDIHGDYEQFIKVLESAELIDGDGNWIGGKAHLVQTGDVVDRGPDSRAIMDLLMKLEKQAAAAGGGVHPLIGNHEALDIDGDTRYVSPAEFAAFRTGDSAGNDRFAYIAAKQSVTAMATPQGGPTQEEPEHPPGFAEWRQAFGPNGVYGRWIRSHNTAIKINRTLFVHAGITAKYADWTLDRINGEVRKELNDSARADGGIVTDEQGPLWTRDLAQGDEAQLAPVVDQILKHFDADRIVIGHTYSDGAITPRFGGKVILIDVGLSRVYDRVQLGCLEIDRNHAYALHRGHGLELPDDENGPDMLRYLRQAAALDPHPSPLEARIRKLEAKTESQP